MVSSVYKPYPFWNDFIKPLIEISYIDFELR